jgi:hypothetical protein
VECHRLRTLNVQRERIEAAVVAGSKTRGAPCEEDRRRSVQGRVLGGSSPAHGFQRAVTLAIDDDPSGIPERVRDAGGLRVTTIKDCTSDNHFPGRTLVHCNRVSVNAAADGLELGTNSRKPLYWLTPDSVLACEVGWIEIGQWF